MAMYDAPDGVFLHLTARDLKAMDLGGKSDPYCIIKRVADGAELGKTETIKKTLNPEWSPIHLSSSAIGGDGRVRLEVYDWDRMSKNDLIGASCEVDLCTEHPAALGEWYDLLDDRFKKTGSIELRIERMDRIFDAALAKRPTHDQPNAPAAPISPPPNGLPPNTARHSSNGVRLSLSASQAHA